MALTTGTTPAAAPKQTGGGVQYQHYQMNLRAKGVGVDLGIGPRVAPNPDDQFTSPPRPLSGSQFGSSASAKAIGGEGL